MGGALGRAWRRGHAAVDGSGGFASSLQSFLATCRADGWRMACAMEAGKFKTPVQVALVEGGHGRVLVRCYNCAPDTIARLVHLTKYQSVEMIVSCLKIDVAAGSRGAPRGAHNGPNARDSPAAA